MEKITVFTPTYNRDYTLKQLYDSLCAQTYQEFVWLIIDDGSTDSTHTLVRDWQQEDRIRIEYNYQENKGKMAAQNFAVSITQTELFLCVDSDDYLLNDALENIMNAWIVYKNNKAAPKELCGIVAYKGRNEHITLGNKFPDEQIKFSNLNSLYKSGFKGDASVILRTDILREHPFPNIPEEKYMREAYIFDQIDQEYTYLLVPKIIMVCEYLEDGYSSNYGLLFKQNPKSCAMYHNQKAGYSTNMTEIMYHTIQYIAYAIYSGNKDIVKESKRKIVAIVMLLPGTILSIWRKFRFYNIGRG